MEALRNCKHNSEFRCQVQTRDIGSPHAQNCYEMIMLKLSIILLRNSVVPWFKPRFITLSVFFLDSLCDDNFKSGQKPQIRTLYQLRRSRQKSKITKIFDCTTVFRETMTNERNVRWHSSATTQASLYTFSTSSAICFHVSICSRILRNSHKSTLPFPPPHTR